MKVYADNLTLRQVAVSGPDRKISLVKAFNVSSFAGGELFGAKPDK